MKNIMIHNNKMEDAPTLLWISQLENKNMTEVTQCLDFEKKTDSETTDVMVTKNCGSDYYMKIRFSIVQKKN